MNQKQIRITDKLVAYLKTVGRYGESAAAILERVLQVNELEPKTWEFIAAHKQFKTESENKE